MSSAREGRSPDYENGDRAESLADQALEAIIRSQQLRERSRNLRASQDDSHSREDDGNS